MDNHDSSAEPLANLSPETAAIAQATGIAGTPMALAPCLQCVNSTVIQLADDLTDTPHGLEASAPGLVVYCGRMHRDIIAPVARCSGYEPNAEA